MSPDGHTALIMLCAGIIWLVDIEISIQASGHSWSATNDTLGAGGGGSGSGGESRSKGDKSSSGGGVVGDGDSENPNNKTGKKSNKSGNTKVHANDHDDKNTSKQQKPIKKHMSDEKKKKVSEKNEETEVKGEGEGWYFVTDLGRPLVNADAVFYEKKSLQSNNDDDCRRYHGGTTSTNKNTTTSTNTTTSNHTSASGSTSCLSSFPYAHCRVYGAHPDGYVTVSSLTYTPLMHTPHTLLFYLINTPSQSPSLTHPLNLPH